MALTGTESVGGDVDYVVRARHDVHIAVFVDHTRVARVDPFPVEALHIALVEALFFAEESGQACGRERDGHDYVSHLTFLDFVALVVHGPDVETRHGFASGPRFDW